MIVTREDVRKAIVTRVKGVIEALPVPIRVRYPGFPVIDISEDKSAYLSLDIIYIDGEDTGLGAKSDMRLSGSIVLELSYKDGNLDDIKLCNDTLDALQRAVSSNDSMFPVRTYASRQATPTGGPEQGWRREALVTPFWYDTSRA